MDATSLADALPYDVIEDTEFPVSRLEERFGGDAAPLPKASPRTLNVAVLVAIYPELRHSVLTP